MSLPPLPDRVHIVPMALEHVEGFRATLDAVARERRWLAFVEAPALDDVRKFVERVIQRGDVQLVALDSDRVVGWADIVRRSGPGFEHAGVLGMGLLPEYRAMGLGRRLLEEVLARARSAGIERVELSVWASNEPARKLYERSGFEIEGTCRGARKLDGRTDDSVIMGRIDPRG